MLYLYPITDKHFIRIQIFMRLFSLLFTLTFVLLVSTATAQDIDLSDNLDVEIQELPLSLEEEEEAMIFERHQARLLQNKKELKHEHSQLDSGHQDTEEQLYYLQNQWQQSEGGHNLRSQELNILYKERSSYLEKIAELLVESELQENAETSQEDWEKAPISNAQEIKRLNEDIRKLDSKIAVYEMAIPVQIDELEDLQEQIDETRELADQLLLLQESNQELIRKLDK